MTPHQLFQESTQRPRSWPPYAWAVVAGAAIAMFASVVLLAWQASNMPPRIEHVRDLPTGSFESADEVRTRFEETCRRVEQWRTTQTGIYARDFRGIER